MTRCARFALALLVTLPLFGAAPKVTEMDKALAQIERSATPAEATKPMTYILAHAQEAPALQLFLASAVAINVSRLEDAAYLFYVAQMRTRHDLVRFPPKGTGGDSPGVALGAVSNQLGAEINPAVMREPAVFAKVVTRVSAWTPSMPSGYTPGWAYTSVKEADGKRAFAEHRAGFVKQFGGLSTLLNDPEYFAAFKVMQAYNFSPLDQQKDAARTKEKNAAQAKMLAIEKKRGIEGLFNRKGGA